MVSEEAPDGVGSVQSWGSGPEVVFLSSPLTDPVAWSDPVRDQLRDLGYRVTTFRHLPPSFDWQSTVDCVADFVVRRNRPVALVGWSQGAAIAQEVALAAPDTVTCAALLATYARQNEIDRVLQAAWERLGHEGDDLGPVRMALGLLTAFPPELLADDDFVAGMRASQDEWEGVPDTVQRNQSGTFIATYQDRVHDLRTMTTPSLVMGFELDTDTFAERAREVAQVLPAGEYVELEGVGHAAPFSHPHLVWPPVIEFLERVFPPTTH